MSGTTCISPDLSLSCRWPVIPMRSIIATDRFPFRISASAAQLYSLLWQARCSTVADDRKKRRRRRQARGRAAGGRGGQQARRQRGGQAPANTSWDPVASWYTGWVGKSGSVYHRKAALPTVMRLAAPAEGEKLVDIGCGHGVLSRPVRQAGAAYTGVDFSGRLIEAARRGAVKGARFLHADARRLTGLPGLEAGSHDVAVFMLS